MSPDEIKALRKELSCTARELAGALELNQAEVMSWEKGETFPTKKNVDRMEKLRGVGPSAIPRKAKGDNPVRALADPAVWMLLRKIAAHRKLRDDVAKLAASYADPADD